MTQFETGYIKDTKLEPYKFKYFINGEGVVEPNSEFNEKILEKHLQSTLESFGHVSGGEIFVEVTNLNDAQGK